MPFLKLIVIVIIVGVLLWLANRYIPMDGTVKTILNILVICLLVFWILKVLGVLAWLGSMNI